MTLELPACRALTGTSSMFQYQVVIEDEMINTNEIEFRAAPCHCQIDTVTCLRNSDCIKFNMPSVLVDLHWKRKTL